MLKRVFELVSLLGQEPSPRPLRYIAQKSGLPKPATYRLLGMLKQLGYVDSESDGDYVLTSKIHELIPVNRDETLKKAALPMMGQIYSELNETTNLAYLDGHRVKYAHIMESTQPLRWSPLPVSHEEVLTTALGRVMFAYLAAPEREDMLPGLLERLPMNRKMTPEKVKSLVRTIRRHKMAFDLEENCEGAVCFGIPFLRNENPIGAISVTVPTPRLDTKYRKRVVDSLRKINNRLND